MVRKLIKLTWKFICLYLQIFLKDIEKLIGKRIPLIEDQPFHSQLVVDSKLLTAGRAKTLIDGRNDRPNTPFRRGLRNNYKKN